MPDTPDWDASSTTLAPSSDTEVDYGELLVSLQRLTEIGIWSYDASGNQLWWSDQAKRIHGIDTDVRPTFEEIVGRYTDEDQGRVNQCFTDAVQEQESFRIDVGLAGEGTTERSIRLYCEPNADGDEATELYGAVQDITDVKRREQRIEILRRTSQELRGASSRREVAEIIADAAKNILGLVNTTVRLVDEDRTSLKTVVATEECVERAGDRPDYSISEETPAARVYRSGEPEIHANHERTMDDHNRGELQSGLYVPIGDHGVLSAGDIVVDAFQNHDLEAAGLLGQLGAEAITRIGWMNRSRAV